MQNVAIGVYIIVGLILFLQQKKSGTLKVSSFSALAFLILLALVSPLISFVLAIPVLLVVWFDNYQTVLNWWAKLQKSTIKVGGN